MPRIRSLKPEFFSSLVVTSLEIPARLTFAGMWCYADDEGRGICDADLLKAFIWPKDRAIDTEQVNGHLDALEAAHLIARYRTQPEHTAENSPNFFAITNWSEHQHPEKPKPSKYPKPPGFTRPRRIGERSGTHRGGVVGRKGEEGSGEGEGEGKGVEYNDDSARGAPIIGSPRHLALSDQMTLTSYRSALENYLRAAHDPDRLLRDLEDTVSGLHGPGGRAVTPDVIGQAMHEMLVANVTQLTSRRLAAFIRGVLEPPVPRRQSPAEEEDEWTKAGRELEAKAEAERQRAAVRHA